MSAAKTTSERLGDIALACAIGVASAWWLVTWWTE